MDSILSMEMLLSTLRMAIPLVLASVGGTLCERSGIINLGIEGMMLSGAFGAVYGTYISGNPWIGVLFAILVGGLFGILHAVLCIRFKTNQSVSGIGINVFVSGLTIVLTGSLEIRWNEWTSGKTSSSQYSGTKRASSNRNIVYRTVPISFYHCWYCARSLVFYVSDKGRTQASCHWRPSAGSSDSRDQCVIISLCSCYFLWNVVRACRWLSFHRAKQLICKRNGCRPGIHGIGRNDSRWVESFGGSVRKPCICICTGIEN